MIAIDINGTVHQVDAAPDTPLLWVLREWLQMTGTKYGCGVGQCGACSILVDGTVERIAYQPGSFVNADFDKASTENERNAMVLSLPGGERLTVVQVAGLVARRILCYVKAGDALQRGQRYGFIRFGSRVDVYLPLSAQPRVAVGDVVHATTTILAQLAPADNRAA